MRCDVFGIWKSCKIRLCGHESEEEDIFVQDAGNEGVKASQIEISAIMSMKNHQGKATDRFKRIWDHTALMSFFVSENPVAKEQWERRWIVFSE